MAGKISNLLESFCRSAVEAEGYELVDLEFVKEYQNWILRVFIDHSDGIGLDDCEKVSKALSSALDEGDPISQQYVLEVSSPGLDRPLKSEKDFERFKGHRIKVKTYTPFEGRKNLEGLLVGLIDEKIVLVFEEEEKGIPRDQVASVRLVPEF
jgi:ribosome maturation factor RimP